MNFPNFGGYRSNGGCFDDPYASDASAGSIAGGGCGRGSGGCFSLPSMTISSAFTAPSTVHRRARSGSHSGGGKSSGRTTADPSSKEYTSEAEALMVKELTQLSLKERNVIEEEIHGVGDEINETPQLIEQTLKDFQIELDRLTQTSASTNSHHMMTDDNTNNTSPQSQSSSSSSSFTNAYQQAFQKSPEYVSDPKLRLKFLRAERFDPPKAAKRFIKYFQAIMEHFGPHQLCKDITWNDLCQEDQDTVNTCSFWVDKKDQMGRRLVWIFPQYEIYSSYKNQVRNVFYQIMNALEDEETQRKGFIKVVYAIGGEPSRMKPAGQSMDTDLFFKGFPTIFECLPFRLIAMHYCFDGPKMRPVIATVQYVIGKAGRLRFRAHYGSHIECQYRLMTFGIPKSNIPLSDSGDVPASMSSYYDYLDQMKQQQKEKEATAMVAQQQSNTAIAPKKSSIATNSPPARAETPKSAKIIVASTTKAALPRADVPRSSIETGVVGETQKETIENWSSTKEGTKKKSYSSNATTSSILSSVSNQKRRNSDSSHNSTSKAVDNLGVTTPSSNDVLLGRGKPFQEYPGNVRLAILVDRYRERYMEAGRCDKAIISQHLVDQIKNADGRFLKKLTSDGNWVEVSDEVARDKVGHGFRTKPRNRNPKKSISNNKLPSSSSGNNMRMKQPQNNNNLANATFHHHPNVMMFPTMTNHHNNIGEPAGMNNNVNTFGAGTPVANIMMVNNNNVFAGASPMMSQNQHYHHHQNDNQERF